MDPVVSKAFEEMLKKMEELDKHSAERWERLEKRFEDAGDALQGHEQAIEIRVAALEDLTSAQYTAAVVSDNWGARFDLRIDDLEQRMADLELIRLAEIHDERDDRLEALEGVVRNLQI